MSFFALIDSADQRAMLFEADSREGVLEQYAEHTGLVGDDVTDLYDEDGEIQIVEIDHALFEENGGPVLLWEG